MRRASRLPIACPAAWCVLAALAGGCRTAPPGPQPEPQGVQADACAERLHDLCGQLLLYHSLHKRLPAALDELSSAGGLPLPPLVCPVSNKPYVYNPAGLAVPGRQGRVVVYDAEPSHAGMRWAILAAAPAGTGLLTANVILISEENLTAARRQPPAGSGGD